MIWIDSVTKEHEHEQAGINLMHENHFKKSCITQHGRFRYLIIHCNMVL